jgi:8-amino-7-oxononanoate synthase
MTAPFLTALLEKKLREDTYRELPDLYGKIDFCSNDYLGLSASTYDNNTLGQTLPHGATGSRLISGNHPIATETEDFLARFHGADAGLLYNSGYTANLGLITSVVTRNDIIIHDEFIHASIIDGIRLSGAHRHKFRHNDLQSLEHILTEVRQAQKEGSNIFVIVESIYSMDGDIAPLQHISDYCQAANAYLIVDEAHAVGVKGDVGKGMVSEYRLESVVFARVVTFGKAIGLHGAVVLGSKDLIKVLINYSRPFIYTTALPPFSYHLIQKHYGMLDNNMISELANRINYFQKQARQLNHLNWKLNDSPIQVLYSSSEILRSLANHLQQHDFGVKAILSPTVKSGTERIRFSIHRFNTDEEMDELFLRIKEHLLI